VQVIIDNKNIFFNEIYQLTKESVVEIDGTVQKRKNPNPHLATGNIEINLLSFKLLSKALVTPMLVENETDALEEVRLKYRYLDLRRPIVLQRFITRSKIITAIRQYLLSREFIEVETPILSKPTPEGARYYLVPTRVNQGYFYALPQSPQIYKQLLMVGGLNRYFQIARCFRDEDLRNDRQPEFTQLDLEMSFIDEKAIMRLIEKMFVKIFRDVLNVNLTTPFLMMEYQDAINLYGSDKPDLRFDLTLHDGKDFFVNTQFKIVAEGLKNNKAVKYLIVPNHILDDKTIEALRKCAKDNKAFDLMYLRYKNHELNGSIKQSVEKEIIEKIFEFHQITEGTLLLIVDDLQIVNQALGAIRYRIGESLKLYALNDYKFV
jgi:aspartyl-tRNA synthetase